MQGTECHAKFPWLLDHIKSPSIMMAKLTYWASNALPPLSRMAKTKAGCAGRCRQGAARTVGVLQCRAHLLVADRVGVQGLHGVQVHAGPRGRERADGGGPHLPTHGFASGPYLCHALATRGLCKAWPHGPQVTLAEPLLNFARTGQAKCLPQSARGQYCSTGQLYCRCLHNEALMPWRFKGSRQKKVRRQVLTHRVLLTPTLAHASLQVCIHPGLSGDCGGNHCKASDREKNRQT